MSIDEWNNWMHMRPQRRRLSKSVSLHSSRDVSERSLERIRWTPHTLRLELLRMLARTQLSSLDLVMAYDKSEDGTLGKKEYAAHHTPGGDTWHMPTPYCPW